TAATGKHCGTCGWCRWHGLHHDPSQSGRQTRRHFGIIPFSLRHGTSRTSSPHPSPGMRKIHLKSPLTARLSEHFQRELNDSQRAAVTAPDGYNLILAGPGSGKTRVITFRVAYLIAMGVPAGSIMLVT